MINATSKTRNRSANIKNLPSRKVSSNCLLGQRLVVRFKSMSLYFLGSDIRLGGSILVFIVQQYHSVSRFYRVGYISTSYAAPYIL
jgi:hypothetical protein